MPDFNKLVLVLNIAEILLVRRYTTINQTDFNSQIYFFILHVELLLVHVKRHLHVVAYLTFLNSTNSFHFVDECIFFIYQSSMKIKQNLIIIIFESITSQILI
jgi:hypothetical protein